VIELYDFQAALIGKLRDSIRMGRRAPLLVSPTGSGKTVMFAYLVSRLAANGKRVAILAHRKELLDQISAALKQFRVKHQIVGPGTMYDRRHLVHVCSVFSVIRRLDIMNTPDYVIVDEAHHAIPGSSWGTVLETWQSVTVGVTATPERLSGEGLHHCFDHMIIGPTTGELIAMGRLSPYRMYAPPRQIDTSVLHVRGGDFVRSEVSELMDTPQIHGDALSHYRKHLQGAPTIAFCTDVKHAENFAAQARQEGWRAASIDGKLSKTERKRRTDDFAAGRLSVLSSCDLINEGYDVPGAVGCINLRPTQSLALCLQQWGRVLRYVPGKTAIILDHVGNSTRHGLPDSERAWTLQGQKRSARKKDPDDFPVKNCPRCGTVNRSEEKNCTGCGYEFPIKERAVLGVVDGELTEITDDERLGFNAQRAAARDYNALVEIGMMRGMKNPHGWARHVINARQRKRGRRT
jgi:superfamily II DNA or RNA helicase